MSLKPITPKKPAARRGIRPMSAPVVVVEKKSSGGAGGLIVAVLLVLALGGGYFVYNNQQKNEAALAAQKQQLEENAQRVAEAERQRAEHEAKLRERKTALGSAQSPAALGTSAPAADSWSDSYGDSPSAEEPAPAEDEPETSALGSTGAPAKGDGVFNADDTTPPPFDLNAKGKAGQKVITSLDKAIGKAGDEGTFHDLHADLKRSFDVAQPELFADARTLPAFPDKEEKLLRMAHGVYACLNLASELEARSTVPDKDHARFVRWLMKDKAKAARTFTYGVVEHCGITDVSTAADLLDEVRQAYLISPSSGMKKIPAILKKHAKQ